MTPSETPDPAPAAGPVRRPAGVIALAVLTGVQGLALLALGLLAIASRRDAATQAELEAGIIGITVTGAVVAAIGLASLAVSIGLLRASDLARSACTVVATVQLATSVYGLIALHQLRASTVWSLAFAVAVLWFLYGSQRTQAYFAP